MTTPINSPFGDLTLACEISEAAVAEAISLRSIYDNVETIPLNHAGESYVIIDQQSYRDFAASIEVGTITSVATLPQETIDVLAGAVDGATTLCREARNGRFFRISWSVPVI
ncbi:hypothetical protein NVP1081O_014 [Vibrio phage 1.081.O._10N.286.52.C2]|nr:hypothetical protein NVP1081O_014 [Vibrio phage 1.081.O._10N.286.52.C2]